MPVHEGNSDPHFPGYRVKVKGELWFLDGVCPSEPVELEIQPASQR